MTKIEEIVVIAGPSCAGKTYLIKKMRRGECSHLCKILGIDNIHEWVDHSLGSLIRAFRGGNQIDDNRVLFHYDLSRDYLRAWGFIYFQDLFSMADKLTVLTICSSSKELRRRLNRRILLRMGGYLFRKIIYRKRKRATPMIFKKRIKYNDGVTIIDIYKKWFDFLEDYGLAGNWVLNSDKLSSITTASPYDADRVVLYTGRKTARSGVSEK